MRNSASEMFANLSIPSFDDLLGIFFFWDFGQGLLLSIICSYQSFINQPVAFFHIMWTWRGANYS